MQGQKKAGALPLSPKLTFCMRPPSLVADIPVHKSCWGSSWQMTHLGLNDFTFSLQQASHEASQPRGHSRTKPVSPRKVIRQVPESPRIGELGWQMNHLALNDFTLSLQQVSHEASQPRGHSRTKPFSPRKVIRRVPELPRMGRGIAVDDSPGAELLHPEPAAGFT